MKTLRYGNTNTFFLRGEKKGLLIDTDYAGTLPAFFKAIKLSDISVFEINYVLATHYHPDHIGLVGELQNMGVQLVIADVQKDYVHISDTIFAKERRLNYRPIDENKATIISISESRDFLKSLGIDGEILHTPSHSEDSISITLDNGDCIVGDLERREMLAAYEDNQALMRDWENIMNHNPGRVFYAHTKQSEKC